MLAIDYDGICLITCLYGDSHFTQSLTVPRYLAPIVSPHDRLVFAKDTLNKIDRACLVDTKLKALTIHLNTADS